MFRISRFKEILLWTVEGEIIGDEGDGRFLVCFERGRGGESVVEHEREGEERCVAPDWRIEPWRAAYHVSKYTAM